MSKKIVIIGGSSGLGRRLAQLYAAEGCNVGVIARRESLLLSLQQEFPDKIIIKKADIAEETIDEILYELINKLNGVDIVIVAASIVNFNISLKTKLEIETININVTGYTRFLTAAWQYFKEKGQGQIAGITSIAAARGNKIAPSYHASKSFQSIYLEGLRIKAKFEKNNIVVTELIPGYIDTEMGKGERLFWVAPINKAANQAKRAIQKKKARAFLTKRWWFIYHLQRFLPIFIYDSIINGSWKLKRKN